MDTAAVEQNMTVDEFVRKVWVIDATFLEESVCAYSLAMGNKSWGYDSLVWG